MMDEFCASHILGYSGREHRQVDGWLLIRRISQMLLPTEKRRRYPSSNPGTHPLCRMTFGADSGFWQLPGIPLPNSSVWLCTMSIFWAHRAFELFHPPDAGAKTPVLISFSVTTCGSYATNINDKQYFSKSFPSLSTQISQLHGPSWGFGFWAGEDSLSNLPPLTALALRDNRVVCTKRHCLFIYLKWKSYTRYTK